MKKYTLSRPPTGVHLLCEAEVANVDARGKRTSGTHIESKEPLGPFETGNVSKESMALALAIMQHYYGASEADPAATAQAARKARAFQEAFLAPHQMPLGSRYEISSEVIDRWNALP